MHVHSVALLCLWQQVDLCFGLSPCPSLSSQQCKIVVYSKPVSCSLGVAHALHLFPCKVLVLSICIMVNIRQKLGQANRHYTVCPNTQYTLVQLNSHISCKLCSLRRCLCRCASVTHQAICPIKGPQVREGAGSQEQLWLQGLGCPSALLAYVCTVTCSVQDSPLQEDHSLCTCAFINLCQVIHESVLVTSCICLFVFCMSIRQLLMCFTTTSACPSGSFISCDSYELCLLQFQPIAISHCMLICSHCAYLVVAAYSSPSPDCDQHQTLFSIYAPHYVQPSSQYSILCTRARFGYIVSYSYVFESVSGARWDAGFKHLWLACLVRSGHYNSVSHYFLPLAVVVETSQIRLWSNQTPNAFMHVNVRTRNDAQSNSH